jgi:transposase-like protein
MREKKYRTYPKEFKLEALELLRSSGKSAEQERDILKKAVSIFSKLEE